MSIRQRVRNESNRQHARSPKPILHPAVVKWVPVEDINTRCNHQSPPQLSLRQRSVSNEQMMMSSVSDAVTNQVPCKNGFVIVLFFAT